MKFHAILPLLCAATSLEPRLLSLQHQSGAPSFRLQIDSSSALSRQILSGAPCDLFFSADRDEPNRLIKAGRSLIDTAELLTNALVIVVPTDHSQIESWMGLIEPKVKRIATAEPDVPLGRYARSNLSKLGLLNTLEKKLISAPTARSAVALVERGNVDAGIVFQTDALASKAITISSAPPLVDPNIKYVLVRLSSSPQSAQLFSYLKSPEALSHFRQLGFGLVTASP